MLVLLQISESFKRFGVTEDCQHLLVARFDAEPAQVSTANRPITDPVPGSMQTSRTWIQPQTAHIGMASAANGNLRTRERGAAAFKQATNCH